LICRGVAFILLILPSLECGVEWERYLDVGEDDFDVFFLKLVWYPFRSIKEILKD